MSNKKPSKEVVQSLAHLVQQAAKEQADNDGMHQELELSLGTQTPSGFQPGVAQSHFTQILNQCTSYAGWDEVQDWETTLTFALPNSVRMTRYQAGNRADQFEVKERRACIDLLSSSSDFGVRASWRTEMACDPPNSIDQVAYVRCRKRKSFLYHNTRIDLSMVWEGETYDLMRAAVQAQRQRYEVEVEAINVVDKRGSTYTAQSLLYKIRDFLPSRNISNFIISTAV